MTAKLTFKHEGKTYLYSLDQNKEIQPHASLKGDALINARQILPLARQHLQNQPQQASIPKAKIFGGRAEILETGKEKLLNSTKLKNSSIKILEQNLNLIDSLMSSSKGPMKACADVTIFDIHKCKQVSQWLKPLSEKLNTLSTERKKNIESKMGFIRRFFHKLGQRLKGGGWRTLAKRSDDLREKINEKMAIYKAVNEKNDLLEVCKNSERGIQIKTAVIEKLNEMSPKKFESKIEFFMEEHNVISASSIYPHLNEEKRKIMDDKFLAQTNWHKLANLHFFVNESPIENFRFEPYLEKFSRENEYVKIIATSKFQTVAEVSNVSSPDRDSPPTNYLKNFSKFMIKEMILKNADDSGVVVSLLEEMMRWPTQQEMCSYQKGYYLPVLDNNLVEKYNADFSKITIQETLNENTLNQEVVRKLKANIDCERYHLFIV